VAGHHGADGAGRSGADEFGHVAVRQNLAARDPVDRVENAACERSHQPAALVVGVFVARGHLSVDRCLGAIPRCCFAVCSRTGEVTGGFTVGRGVVACLRVVVPLPSRPVAPSRRAVSVVGSAHAAIVTRPAHRHSTNGYARSHAAWDRAHLG
jgi:hypothetical protein